MSMTKEEYHAYETAVRDFFESEGINNLSGGHLSCPTCGPDTYDEEYAWDDADNCPSCGESREGFNEPFFSWNNCDCCGRPEGGDREHATGYNPTTEEIQEYTVCEDCIYYAEYGRLPDMTMLDIESDDGGPRYVVTVGNDVRECYKWNDHYIHVLNTSWQLPVDHKSIVKVTPLST